MYIVEAHPADGWQLEENTKDDVCFKQPRSTQDRIAVAKAFSSKFDVSVPVWVDGADNKIELAYEARPERLYVVSLNSEGCWKVSYRGGVGPYQFDPVHLRQHLMETFKSE
eukprot:Rmarinus@m.17191